MKNFVVSPGEWLRDSESVLFFATALAASQLPARPEERPVRDQEVGTALHPALQEVSGALGLCPLAQEGWRGQTKKRSRDGARLHSSCSGCCPVRVEPLLL